MQLLAPPLLSAPTATLFPYTTLFRSFIDPPPCQAWQGTGGLFGRRWRGRGDRGADPANLAHCRQTHPRDRKSTRLNSSHVAISYAVFCLKKNKLYKCCWVTRPRAARV